VLWLLAARGDRPEYRQPSRRYVTGTAACAVLLAGTALLPASARIPCLGVGAARPTPFVLGLALVVLLGIPWGLAVAYRLANEADSPAE